MATGTSTKSRAPKAKGASKPQASKGASAKNKGTAADLARSLNVDPKTFRGWLRRRGVHVSKGHTISAKVKAEAKEAFGK